MHRTWPLLRLCVANFFFHCNTKLLIFCYCVYAFQRVNILGLSACSKLTHVLSPCHLSFFVPFLLVILYPTYPNHTFINTNPYSNFTLTTQNQVWYLHHLLQDPIVWPCNNSSMQLIVGVLCLSKNKFHGPLITREEDLSLVLFI